MIEQVKELAEDHLDATLSKLGAGAVELSNEAMEALQLASEAYAQLRHDVAIEALSIDEAAESLKDIESIVADWSYVAAASVRSAFWAHAVEALSVIGSSLGEVVTQMVKDIARIYLPK